jgi:hypothetical protein
MREPAQVAAKIASPANAIEKVAACAGRHFNPDFISSDSRRAALQARACRAHFAACSRHFALRPETLRLGPCFECKQSFVKLLYATAL